MTARQINPLHSAPGVSGNAAVSYEDARAILTRASGFLSAYDFTLNPYNGCSFGCTYCYAAFFSRGGFYPEDWGKWVRVKKGS